MSKTKISFYDNRKSCINVLILITCIVYIKSLFYGFSPMDEDWLIIRDEPFIKDWGNLFAAFNDAVQGLYYRPLLIVTFILDYHIGNLSPFIYHFTNLLIHTICVVTLYKLLLELKAEKMLAFLCALLFSIHPIALHAVAWIPGRNDLLLCLFSLLSCYNLVKYIHASKRLNIILHVLFFMMALFSKENAVFLLPVFIYIFFIPKSFEKKKLMLASGIWLCQIIVWYIMMSGVIKTTISMGPGFLSSLKGFFAGFLIFTGKALIPVQQSVSPNMSNSVIQMVIGVVVIALLAFAWHKFGVANKKIAVLGLLIYFSLLLVPVWFGATSPMGEHLEHRAYTSMFGFMILVSQLKLNTNLKLLKNLFWLTIIVLTVKTVVRMEVYKDGFSYINEAAADSPKNYFFHARKGNLLFDKSKYREALESFNAAIALYDKKPQVYNERANVYRALNKKEEAIADYTKAYELGKSPQVLLYRCLTYKQFGDIGNAVNDLMALNECCREYIPKGLEAELMGQWVVYQLDELNKLIAVEPDNALLYVNRAKFYIDRRMGNEALADLKKACELEPKNETFKGYYKELSSSFPR